MIPDIATIKKLHQKYAGFAKAPGLFDLVFEHGQIVCEIALWAADRISEPVDYELLQAACLLHDVGTYSFFDENGQASGYGFYPMHALVGAKLVLDEGYNPRIAAAIETHVLLGLSKEEIEHPTADGRSWPLPAHDYRPRTIEGELLCYADRFHSKNPQFNDPEKYLARLRKETPQQGERFATMIERFGLPDIPALARKYHQKIS